MSPTPNDRNAGASRVYHTIADGLSSRGHEVRLLHREDFRLPSNPIIGPVLHKLYLPQLVSARIGFREALMYDVLMAPSGMAYPLFRRLRSYRNRPLLVNHQHGLALFDRLATVPDLRRSKHQHSDLCWGLTKRFPEFWDARAAQSADVTIVQNQRDVSYLKEAFCERLTIRTAYPSVHPEILAASDSVPAIDQRTPGALMWFGSWIPRKGFAYLPDAFDLILAREPQATLTIGGVGLSPTHILRCFSQSARSKIRVLPRISISEQIDEFGRHAVFLFPSLSEGFGLAIAEAMVLGLAAVSTATGFGADHLRHGETGLIISKSSSGAIADAVLELIRKPQLRHAIAAQGRSLAQRFSTAATTRTYEEIFHEQQLVIRRNISV